MSVTPEKLGDCGKTDIVLVLLVLYRFFTTNVVIPLEDIIGEAAIGALLQIAIAVCTPKNQEKHA